MTDNPYDGPELPKRASWLAKPVRGLAWVCTVVVFSLIAAKALIFNFDKETKTWSDVFGRELFDAPMFFRVQFNINTWPGFWWTVFDLMATGAAIGFCYLLFTWSEDLKKPR